MAAGGPIIVVMGVTGAGKTTVGRALAERFGLDFVDGDDLHPEANVAKMASGRPLDDADRAPWLARIAAWIEARRREGRGAVVACSALRRRYRDVLRADGKDVTFLLLHGESALLAERMAARQGHFMPPGLLDSQLATLELPEADEPVVVVGIAAPVDAIVAEAADRLGLA